MNPSFLRLVIFLGVLLSIGASAAEVPTCFGHAATLVGTDDDDTLRGTQGNDVIVSLGGHDKIDGKGGNDLICAGDGNDRVFGRAGDDTIDGGNGNDVLVGHSGNDVIEGGAGNDTLRGAAGNDDLVGGDGNDSLSGGDGNDALAGGAGVDRLNGGNGVDTLDGDQGSDILAGGSGNDILNGGDDDDVLNGNAGNDTVLGGAGQDKLSGSAGNDRLDGGGEADLLNGGGGADRLIGGTGDDRLAGGAGADGLDGGSGVDAASGGPGRDVCIGEQKVACEAPGQSVAVEGTILVTTGQAAENAQVTLGLTDEAEIAVARAARQRAKRMVDWTQPDHKQRGRIHRAQAAGLTDALSFSAEIVTTSDATGRFSASLETLDFPVRVLANVSYAKPNLPTVQSALWKTAETGQLDMGTVKLPDAEASAITVTDGAGQNASDTLRVRDLPINVSRMFGATFDPEADKEVFPGEFAEAGNVPLNSSVFVWMEAVDAGNNPLNSFSQAVAVRSLVPTAQWKDLEDTTVGTDRIEIPIYYFDETTDLWQQASSGWLEDENGTVIPEDAQSVILDGSFSRKIYAAFTTDHFSWMNVDYAYIGPWTLSRMDSTNRNNDCLYNAMRLAKTIARSTAGHNAYAKVNQPGANLDQELMDAQGPELKTFSPTDPQEYGVYNGDRGNAGDREDEIFINTRMWSFCSDAATENQKKAATWMMALTILHETAHWKDDVKKFPDAGDTTPPDGPKDTPGEEGWQLERDLIGKDLFLNDDGTIREGTTDGPAVAQNQVDQWLNPATWPASTPVKAAFALADPASVLEVSVVLPKTSFDIGESIPATLTLKNLSGVPIRILNKLILEDYPVRFDIIHVASGKRVGFRGGERKLGFSSADFATLEPGASLSKTVDLVHDDAGNPQRYNLAISGDFQVTAVYSGLFGLPETVSAPATFTINPGARVSGTVRSALDGIGLAGATVRFLKNNVTSTIATTDSTGKYSVSDLANGSYSLEARAPGFLRATQAIEITRRADYSADFNLSALLTEGELRLVLTWGDAASGAPSDLDSHLWLPAEMKYHIYYSQKGLTQPPYDTCPFAGLDLDDTSWSGPETTTIGQRVRTGNYVYAIYNYSGTGSLATSAAQVQVYDAQGLRASYAVPATGSGRWWKVLSLDGATGGITEINELTDVNPEPYPESNVCPN